MAGRRVLVVLNLKPAKMRDVMSYGMAQFLPLALVTAVAVGCAFPAPGVAAGRLPGLTALVTTAMFVISGLQLRQGEAAQALKARGAVAYGLASILLLTPLAALAVLRLPLQPELAVGLAVFCCMPTALSSGVTLTQALGGNVALALLLTVATNTLGVFTMPLMLPALLGPALAGGAAAGLEPAPLLVKLVKSVLLPTLVGAGARAFVPGAAAFVDARRKYLAYANALLLALVPWTQISAAVASRMPLSAGSLLGAGAAAVGVHFAFLALNTAACRRVWIGASTELFQFGAASDPASAAGLRRALVLTSSVKTLPVAVAVLAGIGPALGPAAGVAVIPALMAHLGQIVIDSVLVARWRAADAAAAAAKAA
ncbi:MAG: putative sodium bile acid cotransporter [Monoraphidium minutum]|nr:MAG: putative sodium bile acid cotransporter [Monoraphidium minutum]